MEPQPHSWASDLVGQSLGGRYRLDRLIAAGGMGAVFLGLHRGLGTHVAVKLLLPSLLADPVVVQRFLLEARTAASVGRRGVVEILDLDIDQQHGPYLVMELLSGQTLSQRLKEQMGLEEAAEVVERLLETLEVVHARGIIHRDIKPGNVFLADDPDLGQVVKILDFGIARVRETHDEQVRLTRAGFMIGTPRFMAPEQMRREADTRTDLYAVGLVFYCCLGNQVPYPGIEGAALLTAIMAGPPAPLRSLRPGLPAAVYALIDRAIERDPARRFQSASEMRSAVNEACLIHTLDIPSPIEIRSAPPMPPIEVGGVVPTTRSFDAASILSAMPSTTPTPDFGASSSASSFQGSSHASPRYGLATPPQPAPAQPSPASYSRPPSPMAPDPFPERPPPRRRLPLILAGLLLACIGSTALLAAAVFASGMGETDLLLALGRCPSAPSGYRAVCGEGYFVEVPRHYEEGRLTVRSMVESWVDRTDTRDVPINVTLVRQSYRGDTESWAEAGVSAIAGQGQVFERTSTQNGRDESVEVYAEYTGPPAYRELSRSLVHGRRGWVLRCQGSTQGDFAQRRDVCERILRSFRVAE